MNNFWKTLEVSDKLATLEINSWHSVLTDPIWTFFSDIPVWFLLYAVIIIFLCLRLGWKKGLVIVGAALLTFAFCDLTSNLVKTWTARPRPCNDMWMLMNGLHILEDGGTFGFFSAHAANAFGIATCTWLGFRMDTKRKYRWYAAGMFFWAFMVSASRIFVGKHYLGDVIVGICVGILAGWAFYRLARIVIKRFFE